MTYSLEDHTTKIDYHASKTKRGLILAAIINVVALVLRIIAVIS